MIIETVLMIAFAVETLPPLPDSDIPPPCIESGLDELACYPVDDSGK
jgi:hypothetical protein